ncbi:phage protein [Streptococcus acidominimus]|uniref:Phage protein n=1 Tax=Streptococcus acidominimus TaxID=1326 RepID=A0A380JKY0_STRAI|nr:phage protein [Streptococcus acidominimus]
MNIPNATYEEVAEALNFDIGFVRSNVSRDVNQYKICARREDGSLDYDYYYKISEEKKEFLAYTKEVLLELVEQLA